MSELSPTTKGLLRAARQDGPGAAGRAQIWSAVSAKAAGGGALGAAGGKAAASAATAKLFAMGALLGSAQCGSASLAVVLHVHVGGPSLRPDGALDVHADTESEARTPTARPDSPVRGSRPLAAAGAMGATAGAPLAKHAGAHSHATADDVRMPLDSLGREAELVAEARGW